MLVDRIDEDKDGFVTVEEMKKWIKHAQKRWIYDDVDRQWKSHDLNGDGVVSWEEYKNATYGYILGMTAHHLDTIKVSKVNVFIKRLLCHMQTLNAAASDLQMILTLKMASLTNRWCLVMRGDSKWLTKTRIWRQTKKNLQLFFTLRSMITWRTSSCWWLSNTYSPE